MRNVRVFVVVVAGGALSLAGCSSHPEAAAGPDAAAMTDAGGAGTGDAGSATGGSDAAPGPDLSCYGVAPPTAADPSITLAGTAETFDLGGGISPVGAAELVSFHTGTPDVLARLTSAASGAFSTGALSTGGHPLDAYLKASKAGYRTTFLYPPEPFTKSLANLPLPMISDGLFASVKGALGAAQNDNKNGVLLVAVADCSGQPLAGAALTVEHGNGVVGHAYDLGTMVPGAGGVFLVFDVPDGKASVSASYDGMTFPSYDVVVRRADRCPGSSGTLTATAVLPGA